MLVSSCKRRQIIVIYTGYKGNIKTSNSAAGTLRSKKVIKSLPTLSPPKHLDFLPHIQRILLLPPNTL